MNLPTGAGAPLRNSRLGRNARRHTSLSMCSARTGAVPSCSRGLRRGGADPSCATLSAMTRAQLDKRPADVAAMFDAVAGRYDLLNDVLSLGQDRRWRSVVARIVAARRGDL